MFPCFSVAILTISITVLQTKVAIETVVIIWLLYNEHDKNIYQYLTEYCT